MNTIQNAKEVYNSIRNSQNIFFLSSQIIPKHRRPRIDEIGHMLTKKPPEPLVLVSTQVIEAGVNFDFDVLIRDIGPIDAIVQAAGRCNRNDNRNGIDSPYYIYRVVKDKNSDREFAKDVYGTISIEIAKSILKSSNSDLVSLVDSYYDEIKLKNLVK